jgi:hypothetical protein
LKIHLKYWLCQIAGWGGWTLINLFFVYLFAHDMYLKPAEKARIFFIALFIEFCWSIFATHLLRLSLKNILSSSLSSSELRDFKIKGLCVEKNTFA